MMDGSPQADGSSANGNKRKGRRKIKIEFIEDKSKRHVTLSKRKAGIMKKAYELSTLTGTQCLLLIASETGHVYTFSTPKLQPLITRPEGKNLIQACLNAQLPLEPHNDIEEEGQESPQMDGNGPQGLYQSPGNDSASDLEHDKMGKGFVSSRVAASLPLPSPPMGSHHSHPTNGVNITPISSHLFTQQLQQVQQQMNGSVPYSTLISSAAAGAMLAAANVPQSMPSPPTNPSPNGTYNTWPQQQQHNGE